jgi:N-acetylneuraminate synthase/N,N'-diacetyllegionaminate synthase
MNVLIISEAGVGHDGKLEKALRLCDAAKIAGADICKFQTFVPELAIDKNSKDYELLKSLALSFTNFKKIATHCEDIKIEFMSTPDDLYSLKFLVEECGVKRIKIGSGSLTHPPLVDAAYRTGLPVILSTGMASEAEIHKALPHDSGFVSIILLHCVSLYPCPIELANLNAITTLKKFGYPVGYSDHTTSVAAIPIAAVALGATIIEKHFTLDKSDKGPDHFMSLNPAELAQMIVSIRSIEKVLGTGTKVISSQEAEMISRVRKGADGRQPGL